VTEGFSWKFRPGAQKLIASATLVLAIEKKTRRLAGVAYGDPVLQRDHRLRQDATGDGSEGRHQRTRRVRHLERCVLSVALRPGSRRSVKSLLQRSIDDCIGVVRPLSDQPHPAFLFKPPFIRDFRYRSICFLGSDRRVAT
jgi:hypothetical protein